ncbi:MAG: hypothetical protein CMJ58_21495 [Planctomycetaceae bacterium]|nr:hypothetical protein [Planctomycetaceae bacterium]
MAPCGRAFAQAGVAGIYLTHGTFAGNDALGLVTEIARFAPGLGRALRRAGKGVVDVVAGELGNFTSDYALRMQRGLAAGAGRDIPVQLFNWSSQNNHIGRADGAVELVCELARFAEELPADAWADPQRPPRVQLWGHSHGGNMFAILTNLLGRQRGCCQPLFDAAERFFRGWRGRVDVPYWQQACDVLDDPEHPLRRLQLDIVTLGTPIRYGWDADGYAKLLHLVNHRADEELQEYLARYPFRIADVLAAAAGDYVHQIGVAGTNLWVNPLALRTFLSDRRLRQLLEAGMPREWLGARMKRGVRVAEEGETLLVDYDDPGRLPHQHLLGHGLYTRTRWLPWQCERVAEAFYGD